jgi:hypothetical protein
VDPFGGIVSEAEDDDDDDDDDGPLRGTPIDPDITIKIHLPDFDGGTAADDLPCGRVIVVSHVVTGQRIPLPRAADGSCPRRAPTIEESGERGPTPIEFEPAGCLDNHPPTCTHWIQHKIGDESSVHVDTDRCEVVVDEAIGRDEVHRKVLRHLTPLQIDHLLGQPPAPADLTEPEPPSRLEQRDDL